MWSVRVCVACLATDVRMYSMSVSSLLQPYQILSGVKNVAEIPQKLCWECAALVNKFNLFRRKCERAHQLLRGIYDRHNEITEDAARNVNRKEHNLASNLSVTKLKHTSFTLKSHTKQRRRKRLKKSSEIEEAVVKLEGDVKLEDLKMEDCESTPYLELTDDGDYSHDLDDKDFERNINDAKAESVEMVIEKARKLKKTSKKDTDIRVREIILTLEEARETYTQKMSLSKYDKYPYKCLLCLQAFKEQKTFKKHQESHSSKRGAYECGICRRRFRTKEAEELHQTRHFKKFVCKICAQVTYTRETAKNHFHLHKTSKSGKILRRLKQHKKQKPKRKSKSRGEEIEAEEILLTQEQQMEAVRERQNTEAFVAAKYKCMLCFKTFNEAKTYNNHILQHDPVSGGLECDICKLRYNTRKKIYKHISNNHMKKFECRLCPHVCYNRSFAINHNRWHKGVIYKCDICGFTFDKMTSHRNHLRIKHPSEHVCEECGEPFVSRVGVLQHINKMHSLKRDLIIGTGEAELTGPRCADCDIQFTSEQAWTRHILISPKHEHEKHKITNGCQYCGETFKVAADFKRHYITEHRKHRRIFKLSPGRQFPTQCALCEETIASAGKYWQHFRTQHPGKPFPLTRSSFICEYCGNWFKNKSALDVHKQTHNVFVAKTQMRHRNKPYVCEWCGKSFAYDCNLKKHELTVHCPHPVPSSSHHMQIP